MSALPMMNADEIGKCEIIADESGFGALQTAAGNLPLRDLSVGASISGLLSRVTMQQTFVNAYDRPLEATYIFPLPNRAAVVGFKMIVNDRVIDGLLKERGEARREYQEAIEQGHRASIVEEERPDVFTMRVGNIAPGEHVKIELTMTNPLVFAEGEATFRFPLVVAPRYIPGTPLDGGSVGDGVAHDTDAVPDASRITPPTLLPGFPNPVQLAIEVDVDHRVFELHDIRSSLHAVQTEREGTLTRVRIEPGEKVNRDFILRFNLANDQVESGLTLVPDKDGDEGTFFATVLPPATASKDRRPRDIVFVLDRSGSMSGWKMVAARRALGRMVDTLTLGDRFGLVAFDDSIEQPKFSNNTLIDATNRNRYRAIEWLATVDARGGTEMAQPIFQSLEMLGDGYQDRDRMIVLVTDGQVGNEDQILRGVKERLKGSRVFTVGIDQAINAGFVTRLADLGRGQCELVESEDRLDEVMDRLHRTIEPPLITEVTIDLKGATLLDETLTPSRMSTLFCTAPLVFSGRYRGATKKCRAKLRGAESSGARWSVDLPAIESDDHRLASIWAKTRLRDMEDQYATMQHANFDSKDSLRKQIIATSLQFSVLCKFTSFVAVDHSEKVDGDLHRVTQPVESPEGWDMMSAPKAKRKMRKRSAAPPPPARPKPMPMAAAPQAFGGRGFGDSFEEFDGMSLGSFEMDDEAPMEALKEERAELKASTKGRQQAPQSVTRTGALRGAIGYLSPEAARGEKLDATHDVFVLGVFAFELLTGVRLFSGASDMVVLSHIVAWDVARLNSHAAKLGAALPVLQKALAARRTDRYASAAEFKSALENVLDAAIDTSELLGKTTAISAALPDTLGDFEVDEALAQNASFTVATASRHGNHGWVIRFIPTGVDPDWASGLLHESPIDDPAVAQFAEGGRTPNGDVWAAYRGSAAVGLGAIHRLACSRSGLTAETAVALVAKMANAVALVHATGERFTDLSLDEFVMTDDGDVMALGLGSLPKDSPGFFDRLKGFISANPNTRSDSFWK